MQAEGGQAGAGGRGGRAGGRAPSFLARAHVLGVLITIAFPFFTFLITVGAWLKNIGGFVSEHRVYRNLSRVYQPSS